MEEKRKTEKRPDWGMWVVFVGTILFSVINFAALILSH